MLFMYYLCGKSTEFSREEYWSGLPFIPISRESYYSRVLYSQLCQLGTQANLVRLGKIGLTNILLQQNSFLCRGLTVVFKKKNLSISSKVEDMDTLWLRNSTKTSTEPLVFRKMYMKTHFSVCRNEKF